MPNSAPSKYEVCRNVVSFLTSQKTLHSQQLDGPAGESKSVSGAKDWTKVLSGALGHLVRKETLA